MSKSHSAKQKKVIAKIFNTWGGLLCVVYTKKDLKNKRNFYYGTGFWVEEYA